MKIEDRAVRHKASYESSKKRTSDAQYHGHHQAHLLVPGHDRSGKEANYNSKNNK